ncbi:MAG: hypothetical protein HY263_11815 [Chloroflexi bacterium]|nr:hypothetical protein [Chloroflexota bacterium]
MTTQRELDRILDGFLADGTNELADRVIQAALADIDHTPQRRHLRAPRRLFMTTMQTRLAVAAVIGVLAIGGGFYLLQRNGPQTGVPVASPSAVPTLGASPIGRATPPAGSPGPTALVGPMGVGRQIQTSTRLNDGRVLIAGGYALGDGSLASAVLYDPVTNTFSPTGPMAGARGYHTATLLKDGRVLVVGGGTANWSATLPPEGAFTFLASAEIYDPATGTFTPTGPMATPREVHTATLLEDGRVLIVGGMTTQSESVASAELFDPATGTFSTTGTMKNARAFHTATRLGDGRVLIVGGSPAAWNNSSTLDSAEIYDPATGTFSTTGSLSFGLTFHAATLLKDGRVLITGGNNGYQGNLASTEIYDPISGTFTAGKTMVNGRVYQTTTLLDDGRVLITGGGDDYTNRRFLSSAELYDPATGTFVATGSLATARTYHAATLLTDGRVLVTGGYGADAPVAAAEIYDPTTGTFSPAG